MKLHHFFLVTALCSFGALSAPAQLKIDNYQVGDSFSKVSDIAESACRSFTPFREDSKSRDLTNEIWGGRSKIYNCESPVSSELSADRYFFEFIDGKVVTIFADLGADDSGRAIEGRKWIESRFGQPEEISNATEAHDLHMHEPFSEVHAYYANRTALIRQRENGQRKLRTFIYIMDGKSQKISPLHSILYR